jgi:hypothetical protein
METPITPKPYLELLTKIDGARFFKILGRAGYFGNIKALVYYLRQHLVVKNKIVGITLIMNGLKYFFAKGPVASVVF